MCRCSRSGIGSGWVVFLDDEIRQSPIIEIDLLTWPGFGSRARASEIFDATVVKPRLDIKGFNYSRIVMRVIEVEVELEELKWSEEIDSQKIYSLNLL